MRNVILFFCNVFVFIILCDWYESEFYIQKIDYYYLLSSFVFTLYVDQLLLYIVSVSFVSYEIGHVFAKCVFVNMIKIHWYSDL